MKIHEYQGKEILRKYDVPVPRGKVASTPEEAEAVAKELGTDVVVVKAQIHAGGRGKGGGVKLAKSPQEAREIAKEILGMQLVTHQTGPEGKEVLQVLVEEGLPIKKELYIGVAIDRVAAQVTGAASDSASLAALHLAHTRFLGQSDLADMKVSGADVPGTWVAPKEDDPEENETE